MIPPLEAELAYLKGSDKTSEYTIGPVYLIFSFILLLIAIPRVSSGRRSTF